MFFPGISTTVDIPAHPADTCKQLTQYQNKIKNKMEYHESFC